MRGIIPRKVLVGNKGISINIDRDTHRVIKMWARKEGFSMAFAVRVITTDFFRRLLEKRGHEDQMHPEVREKLNKLVEVIREAKKKNRGLTNP